MRIKIREHIYEAKLTSDMVGQAVIELITGSKRHAVTSGNYSQAGAKIVEASAEEIAGMVAGGYDIATVD